GARTRGGPAPPLSHTYHYRNGSALLESVEINGQKVEQHEPDRNLLNPTDNNSIKSDLTFNENGQPLTATTQCGSGGTCSSASAGSFTQVHYPNAAATLPKYKRGLPESVTEGTNGANQSLQTGFTYQDENTTKVRDARGVETTTVYDSWRRPSTMTVSGPGQQLEEGWDYEPTARLHVHRRKQGNDTVTTTFDYDAVGRQTKVTTDHVAANGNPHAQAIIRADYSQMATTHMIVQTGASGAPTTITVDALGRTTKTSTAPGHNQSDIVSVVASDIMDTPVYRSDTVITALAQAYDASGRQTDSQDTDGSATKHEPSGL